MYEMHSNRGKPSVPLIPVFQLSVARIVSVLCRTECESWRRFEWL